MFKLSNVNFDEWLMNAGERLKGEPFVLVALQYLTFFFTRSMAVVSDEVKILIQQYTVADHNHTS